MSCPTSPIFPMPTVDFTSPLPLGRTILPCRLMPGPMAEVTTGNWVRVLTAKRWVKAWWMPFLRLSTGLPRDSRLKAHLAPFQETGLPFIVQLMGVDTSLIARAAARLHALGAAVLDLNCACPSPIVVRNGAGGARLRHPAWIRDTLRAMREAAPGAAVTVKLRCGWDSPNDFPAIADAVRDAAPDLATVHFRTVLEGYRPVLDGLDRLAGARARLAGIPCFGSGDLFTPQDILRMRDCCDIDGVAPARGLLRNPRLLAETEALLQGAPLPPLDEERRVALWRDFTASAPRGFALQMAANLFGRDSAFFRQLASPSGKAGNPP